MFNFPSITAPESQSCFVIVLSYSGINPERIPDPAWEAIPLVQKRSFIPIGIPHIEGASPLAIRKSELLALSNDNSGV